MQYCKKYKGQPRLTYTSLSRPAPTSLTCPNQPTSNHIKSLLTKLFYVLQSHLTCPDTIWHKHSSCNKVYCLSSFECMSCIMTAYLQNSIPGLNTITRLHRDGSLTRFYFCPQLSSCLSVWMLINGVILCYCLMRRKDPTNEWINISGKVSLQYSK